MKKRLYILSIVLFLVLITKWGITSNFSMESVLNGLRTIGQRLYYSANGLIDDFSIDSSSACFNDPIYLNGSTGSSAGVYVSTISSVNNQSVILKPGANGSVFIKPSSNNCVYIGNAIGTGVAYDDYHDVCQFYSPALMYSKTEAELKALTPRYTSGELYYDSTNKTVVVSTGTGVGQFSDISTGATPTGW